MGAVHAALMNMEFRCRLGDNWGRCRQRYRVAMIVVGIVWFLGKRRLKRGRPADPM
jgi:hypothetical protein